MPRIRRSKYSYQPLRAPEHEFYVPEDGPARVWYLVKTNFGKIIQLNLLYIVFCIPIFTIPAATAGLTHALYTLWRTGNCFVWGDFIDEFKTEFPLRMLLWFPLQLIPAAVLAVLYRFAPVSTAYLAGLLLEALLMVFDAWWFPLLVRMDVSSAVSFKNAWILVFLCPKTSLFALLISLALLAVVSLLYPFSVPVTLLFAFSAARLCMCAVVSSDIKTYLEKEE